jgi:molecular chaperone GrpE
MESEPMSAETNLPMDPDATPQESVAAQVIDANEEFILDSDLEPFDLSPDSTAEKPEGLNPEGSNNASNPAEQAGLQATIAELNQSVTALKAQLEDRNSQYMRLAADFENFRKRTQKDKEREEQETKCSTVKELLPVVDNFERARAQIKPQTDAEMNIHKSYQGVYKQLVDAMKKLGVSPMRTEGQEFDPNLHSALASQPTDEFPEGTIMEELMRGYVMGDRVLRHAMVKVAAAPEPGENREESVS